MIVDRQQQERHLSDPASTPRPATASNRAVRLVWCVILAAAIVGTLIPAHWLDLLEDRAGLDLRDEHFAIYFLLALLLPFWLREWRRSLAACLALIPFGVAMEFIQQLAPGRTFQLADLTDNAYGVLLGTMAGFFTLGIGRWHRKSRS